MIDKTGVSDARTGERTFNITSNDFVRNNACKRGVTESGEQQTSQVSCFNVFTLSGCMGVAQGKKCNTFHVTHIDVHSLPQTHLKWE